MKYDIFISHKHTDVDGKITQDYLIAKELFDILTDLGYKVFFSSSTLEEIGSSRYKADIDTALDTAKIMIVVLTKVDYAMSQWVQYEWDSFYNDYLSGVRKEANLFTLTSNIEISTLPRTLRNVQNFSYLEGLHHICQHIKNALPISNDIHRNIIKETESASEKFYTVTGHQVVDDDIKQALALDYLVYDDIYHVDLDLCLSWFRVNPDIYVIAKNKETNKVIAYVNIMPITDECYDKLRNGDFIDTGVTADMVLSYDMPYPYSIYFSSIVIHPDYQNSSVLYNLFNEIIEKFINLGKREVYIKRMLADAVTLNGEKFCKLFGMTKVKGSNHNSTLYEVSLIPPRFRVLSQKTKQLQNYYLKKYNDCPYLFMDE